MASHHISMRHCELCGKGSIIRGKRKLLRGHYNPTSTSRKYPNLQWARVQGVRMRICTNCMKKQTHAMPTNIQAGPKKTATAEKK